MTWTPDRAFGGLEIGDIITAFWLHGPANNKPRVTMGSSPGRKANEIGRGGMRIRAFRAAVNRAKKPLE
jgi:hypothetical protein